jgi:hypothetical protein
MAKNSREPAIRSATQEFPNIFRNPKVHYRVSQEPSTGPYPESDDSSASQYSSIRSILILSSHLYLYLPSGLFPSGFPTKTLHAFLFNPRVLHALLSHSS